MKALANVSSSRFNMFVSSTKIFPLNGTSKQEDAVLADEEALEIRLGYMTDKNQRKHKSIAHLMRSPGQDIPLSLGFLFSRNIIQSLAQIMDVDDAKKNLLRIELSDDFFPSFPTSDQQHVIKTLTDEKLEPLAKSDMEIRVEYLAGLAKNLSIKQDLFHSSGASAACGLFDDYGVVLEVSEDLRPQHAFDKLTGQLLLKSALPLRNHGLVIGGSLDFDLMHRAVRLRCPLIVATGAPSSLAVELAQHFDITLLALLNEDSFNIYHDKERIII
jgi:FdhD protein